LNISQKTKEKVSYTIDINLNKQFKEVCKKKAINMSAWIELQMKELVDQNKELLKEE
jgi:post-segregation antitoxin (ccd killing protein)